MSNFKMFFIARVVAASNGKLTSVEFLTGVSSQSPNAIEARRWDDVVQIINSTVRD